MKMDWAVLSISVRAVALLVTATLVPGVGAAVLGPVGAFAAEKGKKEAAACDRIKEKKKKIECIKTKAAANFKKYKKEVAACGKIKNREKQAECMRTAVGRKKKAGK